MDNARSAATAATADVNRALSAELETLATAAEAEEQALAALEEQRASHTERRRRYGPGMVSRIATLEVGARRLSKYRAACVA